MKMLNTAILLGALAFCSNSFATGIANNMLIEKINVYSNGKARVVFVGDLTTAPATCADSATGMNAFSFNVTTDGEKMMLSLLLAAKLNNKVVYSTGTGVCTVNAGGDTENLNFVSVKQ